MAGSVDPARAAIGLGNLPDARVTRAAVMRPQRHAAVCADLDAAPMPIMRTLCPGAHSRSAERKMRLRRSGYLA